MPTSADPVLRANQLANITPHRWPKGYSGNRKGRPNSGGSLLEYVDELMAESEPGVGLYSLEELEAFAADQRVSRPKAIAANLIVLASTQGFHEKSGRPYCAVLVDMILDRTVGKPVQSVHVHKTEQRTPAATGADLASMLSELIAGDPAMLGRAMANMDPDARAKAIAMLPVDGEATAIE